MIVRFIMRNHLNWQMARLIRPRNSYKFKSDNMDLNLLMEHMDRDIDRLAKTLGALDELNSGLPA